MVMRWPNIDESKLYSLFRGGGKVKVLLLEEIKVMVLCKCRDSLIVIKIGLGLEIDNYGRFAMICNVIVKW